MKTAEEFLKEKNIDYSFFSTSLAKDIIKWMEEYTQQNTLNRDKVMEILMDKIGNRLPFHSGPFVSQAEARRIQAFDKDEHNKIYNSIADAICSLSLPTDDFKGLESGFFFNGNKSTLSEEEFMDKFTENIALRGGINWHSIKDVKIVMDSAKATIKELTKPKEEQR
jgi:hypothetical protein